MCGRVHVFVCLCVCVCVLSEAVVQRWQRQPSKKISNNSNDKNINNTNTKP